MAVISGRFPRAVRRFSRASTSIDRLGEQALFYGKALATIPRALRQYPKETLRLVAEISMGTGALAVIGGTVVIVGFLTLFTGGIIAVQGFSSLGNIGVEALTGFFAAFINVRIAAPTIAGIGLAATIGAGSTAQLGAMRVSEEIDALESIAIRPMPYLVTTRMIAAVICIIPLYSVSLAANYIACQVMFQVQSGQGSGVYLSYFYQFILSRDMVYSVIKVVIFVMLTTFIQCYYGFFASGGPEGVGVAAGHAIRLSIIVLVFANLLLTLVFWGLSPGIRISG